MLLLFVTVVTVVQRSASRKCQKTRVKPENTWGFPGIFGYYPHCGRWRDRRGSLPGLPYCCSAGLTLATVVGEPHCCSVVTVNTSNTVQLPTLNSSTPPRNKCRCPLQPAESLLARARAPPAARSDSVDVRARRPSPLLPAGPCSATPPALRLLPCAPLDVGRKDRFPLGTRLREDRARVVNAARARSPFPGTPVAVTWDPRLKTSLKQRERRRCSSSRRRSAHRDKLGAAVLAAAAAAAASPLASVTAALHLAAASL